MTTLPISILMSVYFNERSEFLNASLNSIYTNQTSKPSEIILVEDGPLSTELYKVIDSWKEKLQDTLKIVKIEKNQGLANALNQGIIFCTYDLVARMDSDDIALPERLEKQYRHMRENLDLSVSSCQIEEWDINLEFKTGSRKLPLHNKDIISFAKYRSPISHPAVIFRKSDVLACGRYPDIYPEDYALWGTMINKGYIFSNLPDFLLRMRLSDSIEKRRGLKFLKGEIKTLNYFKRIGFISNTVYINNLIIKSILRISPSFIKYFLYKNFR